MFSLRLDTILASIQRKTYIKEGSLSEKRFISPRPVMLEFKYLSEKKNTNIEEMRIKAELMCTNNNGPETLVPFLQGEVEKPVTPIILFDKMYISDSSKKASFFIRFSLVHEGNVLTHVDSSTFQVLSNQKNLIPKQINAVYTIDSHGKTKIRLSGNFSHLLSKRTVVGGKMDDSILIIEVIHKDLIILSGNIKRTDSGLLSLLLRKNSTGIEDKKELCYLQFK